MAHEPSPLVIAEARARQLAADNERLIGENRQLKEDNRLLKKTNERLEAENRELRELSIIDDLTGVLNARGFLQGMELRFTDSQSWGGKERRKRRRDPEQHNGTLVALDLTGFKGVNDAISRDSGDQLLIVLAHTLKESVRDSDIVARFGGDEFVILFYRQPKSFVEERMKFIHRRVREITLGMQKGEIEAALHRDFLVDFRYTLVGIDRKVDFGKMIKSMLDNIKRQGSDLRLAHLAPPES